MSYNLQNFVKFGNGKTRARARTRAHAHTHTPHSRTQHRRVLAGWHLSLRKNRTLNKRTLGLKQNFQNINFSDNVRRHANRKE